MHLESLFLWHRTCWGTLYQRLFGVTLTAALARSPDVLLPMMR